MKQKLLMLLAVLLTGGMLVACGPGDDVDEIGGGGIVDEPIGAEDDAAFEDDAIGGDVAVGDDVEVTEADPAPDVDSAADVDVAQDEEVDVAEGEEIEADPAEVQLDVDEETDVEAEGAQDDAAAQADGEEVAGGAAPAETEAVVVTFSQAAEGVAVENVEGAEAETVAATGEMNPDLTLTTGQRYEFAYDGEGDLVFYNANDEEVLSTAGTETTFAQDSEVAAEVEDGRLAFTVTDELAQEIDRYTVGPEDQGGQVTIN